MNPIIKNMIIGVLTGFIVSSVATTASVIITSREHEVKIMNLEKRLAQCSRRYEKIKDDFYKPAWD